MSMTPEQAAWFQDTFGRLVENVDRALMGKRDVVALGYVKGLRVDGAAGTVAFTLELPTGACGARADFAGMCRAALADLPWVRGGADAVDVRYAAGEPLAQGPRRPRSIGLPQPVVPPVHW